MRNNQAVRVCVGVVVLAVALAAARPTMADQVNVYTIGSNPAGNALDPAGNNVGGIPIITWNNTSAGGGTAILSIIAEGIDSPGPGSGELDAVLFNGVFIGDLTQQGFYSPLFNLCVATAMTGPCALNGITGLTTSVFTVNALPGINTLEVDVDAGNWVNEVDVSTLTTVPEPGSFTLLGLGLSAFSLLGLRRRTS